MRKSRFTTEQIVGFPEGAGGGSQDLGYLPAARDQR
jgi:hypothetical protein